MQLATIEQIQEIKAAVDESLIWEYLRISAEIKIALLDNNIATPSNMDQILKEFMEFEAQTLRDEEEQNKLGV